MKINYVFRGINNKKVHINYRNELIQTNSIVFLIDESGNKKGYYVQAITLNPSTINSQYIVITVIAL